MAADIFTKGFSDHAPWKHVCSLIRMGIDRKDLMSYMRLADPLTVEVWGPTGPYGDQKGEDSTKNVHKKKNEASKPSGQAAAIPTY